MLEIRLLGELEVLRDGTAVPLPASRKSRALLAYLAATARPHLRERLCELFWEGPDDPRASLRWSLAKLRPLVDPHLVATRDRVEFRCEGASLDILRICSPGNATTDQLEVFAAFFRGEFLEGLDLPGCFRFQQWCSGERERFRQLHIAILSALTERLGDDALPHARRRVSIDPFNDQAHAALIRLLAATGQHREAMRTYDDCRALFERELNARPGQVVEDARRAIWRPLEDSGSPLSGRPRAAVLPNAFVGRQSELDAMQTSTEPVLLLGEPGIGKSRLLAELRSRVHGSTIYGRAFSSEMVRPYGMWIDALGDFPSEPDRTRLFEAVVRKLDGVALVTIDDLQWIDDASAALLHYIIRSSPTRIICAARIGEIDDNRHAKALARDMRAIPLGPLSTAETWQLVANARAAELSGGNPLFAIELARSGAEGSLMHLIAERLGELDGAAREVVSWAAAIGHRFDAEIVGRATGMQAGEMLAALEKLEQRAIIRAYGDHNYDFTHDLVRDGAYQMMSAPRRTLVHRHIARALGESAEADGTLAGEIVHHAALAGEFEAAAKAAIHAGNRCLRLFAYGEAMSVARRALQMTSDIQVQMRLLEIIVMARVPLNEKIDVINRIVELTEVARREGLSRAAALGPHLLACLYEESNRYTDAAGATIRAAEFGRSADPKTAAVSMATSARCLLVLQRDVKHAESLLRQAEAIGVENQELSLGMGFLLAHQGNAAEAIPHLERAFELASSEQDHWREWIALARLTTLALEQNDFATALHHCERLRGVTAKMKGGSEAVRTAAYESVARFARGEIVDIDSTLARLREADSKSDLAWVLCYLAERDRDRTRDYAIEALAAAEAVGRESEAVIARCLLGIPSKASPNISARARLLLKESRHGRTGARAIVQSANHARTTD